jgi:signal peptidase II
MVINSYLSWTYIQNTGAAFSILSGGGAIQKAFLLAVSLLVSVMVMVWIHKTPAINRQRLFGQFILLSGALGNLLDRAQYGYVVDFIDVHYQNYYWPVFNVADSFIFIGVILLLFERRQPSL